MRIFSNSAAPLALLIAVAQFCPAALVAQVTAPSSSPNPDAGLVVQGRLPPPTLGNFFSMDFTVDAKMAPSKPILAVVKNISGNATIDLYDFTDTRPKRMSSLDLPHELSSVAWKSDTTLILSGRDTVGRRTVWVWVIGQARPVKLYSFDTFNDDYNPRPPPITDAEFKARNAESLARSRDDNAPMAYLESTASGLADEVILNIRNGARNQLEAVSLTSLQRRVLDIGNSNKTAKWLVGTDGQPTLRIENAPRRASSELFTPARTGAASQLIRTLTFEDHFAFNIAGPSDQAGFVTVRARKDNEEFASLYLWNPSTNQFGQRLLAGDGRDILSSTFHSSGKLAGAVEQRDRLVTRAASASDKARIAEIETKIPSDTSLELISSDTDDDIWTLRATGPTQSGFLWYHDRRSNRLVKIGPIAQSLDSQSLGPSSWLNYTSRDGTPLQALVSMPPSSYGQTKLPTIMLPHGGPHGVLSTYEWDIMAAFFSSRGYMVVQPNFRGSSGYGRSFQRAGYRQWGGVMQHDVTDALAAIVADGRADSAKVAIVGGSYGGYSALVGATATPQLYRCAVSLNGVSDLSLQMRFNAANLRAESIQFWTSSIGNPQVDNASMMAASPALNARNAQTPILILSGGEDERVDPANSRVMFTALAQEGKRARFVELPKMRHSPASWRETTIVYAEMEYFLQGCLQGVIPNPKPPADRVDADEKLIVKTSPASPAIPSRR
jgi:dipeptidyl aminopeptidase/acylaminoacyl peptidase